MEMIRKELVRDRSIALRLNHLLRGVGAGMQGWCIVNGSLC